MLKIDKVQLDIIINNDQSRKSLRLLEDEAKELRKQMKGLSQDSQEYTDKMKRLQAVENQMESLRHEIGLTGMTVKELSNRQKELNNILRNLDPRTKEYRELQTELNRVNGRLKELKGHATTAGVSIGKMADNFNRYAGFFVSLAASFTGVILGFRKTADAYNQFEKKVSNLSALTGLAGDDLKWLGDEAKNMSIRVTDSGIRITKGADEILDAFTKMGSVKPELLANKEALASVTQQAIILSQAADMDLEPAVSGLGTVMNQFNAKADQAGRYINVLAAGSQVGAAAVPYISSAMTKFGAVADQANISVETSVALIEAVAEKGHAAEITGTGLKTVMLKLATGADEFNPKVVGMVQALENLKKANLGAKEMQNLFGESGIVVAQTLLNQIDTIKKYEKAVTGTNTAYEQAFINTNNNAAALEQAKNKAKLTAIEMGERLAPALTFSTNAFSYLLKAALNFVKWIERNAETLRFLVKIIGVATTAVISYTVAKKIAEFWTRKATEGFGLETIMLKANALGHNIARSATLLYAAAKNLLTGNITKARQAMLTFNTTVKANPIGLLVSVITGVITALATFRKELSETEKKQKMFAEINAEAEKSIIKEKMQLGYLLAVAKDEKKSKQERMEAIKKLNDLSPQYLGNLTLEKINTEQATKAVDAYIDSLSRKAKAQAIQDKLVEVEKDLIDVQTGDKGYDVSFWQEVKNTIATGGFAPLAQKANVETALANNKKAETDLLKKQQDLYKLLKEQYTAGEVTDNKPVVVEEEEDTNKKGKGTGTGTDKNKAQKDREEELKKIDAYQQEIIKKSKTLTEQEDIDYQERLKKAGIFNKDVTTLTVQELEVQRLLEEEHNKNIANIEFQKQETEKQEQAKRLTEIEQTLNQEFDVQKNLLQQEYLSKKMLKEDFDTEMEILEIAHLETILQARREAGTNTIAIESDLQQKKIALWEKEKKAAQELAEKDKQLAKEKLERNKASVLSSFESGAAALENANAETQAEKVILNSIRKEIKAALSKALAQVMANTLATIPFPFNIALATAAGAAVSTLFDKAIPQFAEGNLNNFTVTGAQDGNKYNATFAGTPQTGLYSTPSLFLAAEKQPEIIIDGPTTRNIMMNYPQILHAIQSVRVRQYAEGNLSQQPVVNNNNEQTNVALISAIDALINKLNQPINAQISYEHIKNEFDMVNAIESRVNLKK